MRDSYELIRKEFKDIETQLMGLLLKDGALGNVDPDGLALLCRVSKLIKASDNFMYNCIDNMESQNKKLDAILEKIGELES